MACACMGSVLITAGAALPHKRMTKAVRPIGSRAGRGQNRGRGIAEWLLGWKRRLFRDGWAPEVALLFCGLECLQTVGRK